MMALFMWMMESYKPGELFSLLISRVGQEMESVNNAANTEK